jgi:hypothetical protein
VNTITLLTHQRTTKVIAHSSFVGIADMNQRTSKMKQKLILILVSPFLVLGALGVFLCMLDEEHGWTTKKKGTK